MPSTQSPDAQLSNKPTLSPNHWANELKFRKNSLPPKPNFFPNHLNFQLIPNKPKIPLINTHPDQNISGKRVRQLPTFIATLILTFP
jgi:hypothetical protein